MKRIREIKRVREYCFLLILICACLFLPKATAFAASDSANGYVVRYSLKGGVNHPSNPARYNSEDGTVVLENPSRKGYTFDGWYTSSSLKSKYRITEITPDTKKIKRLYAKWKANKYTVIFDGNGDDGTKSMSSLVKAYSKEFALTANKFKRNGYKFSGWNTERDGTGKAYKNKACVKKLTSEADGSVTFYAQWKEVKYTISYKNAVVSLPKGILKSYTITSETIALPTLTRKGYTFDGWYTNKKYNLESKIESIPSGSTGNKTLYAHWKKGTSASGAGSRTLVAYFSATNNTKGIAEKIADAAGATLYEIVPAEAYTSEDLNYNNSDSRANKEQNDDGARPAITSEKLNLDEYETVFIGYPIWWGKEPRIIDTFMESYDFTGKTLVNFCTSGSSGIGSSTENLKKMASGATWKDGKRFPTNETADEIRKWVEDLDLTGDSKQEVIKGEEPAKEEVKEEVKENAKLKIQVGDTVLLADFEDNSSAKGFQEKLAEGAVTVSMSDYGSFEKVGALGFDLPRNDTQITTKPGDVILYQGNQITIYYDTNTWNFTRMAKITDKTQDELKAILGTGSVTVTFSLSE